MDQQWPAAGLEALSAAVHAWDLLMGKSRGQLLIAPISMKQLGQSGNDAQLWMCLVKKVKSHAVKNNIAQEPGMLSQ